MSDGDNLPIVMLPRKRGTQSPQAMQSKRVRTPQLSGVYWVVRFRGR